MCKARNILLCIPLIFAVFTEANGSGCEWSGCKEFALKVCKTGATGGSGRHNRYNFRTCGFQGRKDYCCADDCRYVECGVNVIGGIRYTNTVPNVRCGVPSQQEFKEFVCGGYTGEIPLEILTGIHGSSFRSTNEQNKNTGGFRANNKGSGFRSISEDSTDGSRSEIGLRNNDEVANNGGFRNSNSGGFRNSNSGGFRNSNSGGFRNSNSYSGGFRTK